MEGFKGRPLRLELSPLQRVSSDSYRKSIYNKACVCLFENTKELPYLI